MKISAHMEEVFAKPLFMFRSLVLILLTSNIGFAQPLTWRATSGPAGGYVRALTREPSGSLFVGTSGGVFKSTNEGESWALSTNGLGNSLVYSLAHSPNGTLFAGTFYDGMFRSTDNGASWAELNGVITFIVNAIAVNSQGDIFAGDEEGESKAGNGGTVYRSTNNGNTWTALYNGLPDSPVYQIRIGIDGSIFVGMKEGLFRSTNNGASWTLLTNGIWIRWISDVVINPANNYVYVTGSTASGSSVGMFRSTDNGDSFTQLAFPDVHAHTLGMNADGHLFAGTTGFNPALNYSIFRSTDHGDSFVKVDSALAVKKFVPSGTKFFAGTNLGVHLSSDNGHTWQFKGSGMASVATNALASDIANATYAGTFSGQFKTTDGGVNWTRLEIGLTLRAFGSLAVNSVGHVFAVNDLGRVFRSTDRGSTWMELINGLPGIAGQGFIFIHSNDMLFLAHPFRGIMRSSDNGDTWLPHNNGLGANQDIGAFANDVQGNVYAATMLSGIWRSTNNGELWSRVGTYYGYADLMAVNKSGHLFWAYSTSLPSVVYIYRSTDAGATWTRVNISATNAGTVKALLIAPDQKLYVAVYDASAGGVYRSADNGDSFSYVSDGLTEKLVTSFGMDGSGHLLAGTTRGVFRTLESVLTSVSMSDEIPTSTRLSQNYPNPFNPTTNIGFRISDFGLVSLRVFDVLGREVATLVNEQLVSGSYERAFSGEGLAGGVYFYRLEAGNFTSVKKLLLLK